MTDKPSSKKTEMSRRIKIALSKHKLFKPQHPVITQTRNITQDSKLFSNTNEDEYSTNPKISSENQIRELKQGNSDFLNNYNKKILTNKNKREIAKTFKELIETYEAKGYKIPDFSLEHNLFNECGLLDNKVYLYAPGKIGLYGIENLTNELKFLSKVNKTMINPMLQRYSSASAYNKFQQREFLEKVNGLRTYTNSKPEKKVSQTPKTEEISVEKLIEQSRELERSIAKSLKYKNESLELKNSAWKKHVQTNTPFSKSGTMSKRVSIKGFDPKKNLNFLNASRCNLINIDTSEVSQDNKLPTTLSYNSKVIEESNSNASKNLSKELDGASISSSRYDKFFTDHNVLINAKSTSNLSFNIKDKIRIKLNNHSSGGSNLEKMNLNSNLKIHKKAVSLQGTSNLKFINNHIKNLSNNSTEYTFKHNKNCSSLKQHTKDPSSSSSVHFVSHKPNRSYEIVNQRVSISINKDCNDDLKKGVKSMKMHSFKKHHTKHDSILEFIHRQGHFTLNQYLSDAARKENETGRSASYYDLNSFYSTFVKRRGNPKYIDETQIISYFKENNLYEKYQSFLKKNQSVTDLLHQIKHTQTAVNSFNINQAYKTYSEKVGTLDLNLSKLKKVS